MNPTFDAFLRSWPAEPGLWATLAVLAAVYVRGWLRLRAQDAHRWTTAKLAAFLGGLAALAAALASPIETFSGLMLQLHMVQHMLLTMVVPPLLWLGAPFFPLLRGLPRPVRNLFAPVLRSPGLRRLFESLTHPILALPVFVAATWLWHIPAWYQLALRSPGWHYVQHACFLGTALLFWYPVVRPYPAAPRWSLWLLFPYLILADVQNTVLSALFTFSTTVVYSHYLDVPRLAGISALADQAGAGVIMWVPGSLAFLLPLFALGVKMLGRPSSSTAHTKQTHRPRVVAARQKATANAALPLRPAPRMPMYASVMAVRDSFATSTVSAVPVPSRGSSPGRGFVPVDALLVDQHVLPASTVNRAPWDLLRLRGIGRFLRWRNARLCLQLPLLLLAVAVIYDGLAGPQAAPMNLAGVLPWIHWRGVLILGLLAVGNLFCFACPFTLPRLLARRWFVRGDANPQRARWRVWPRPLRNKWLAVALVAVFLWSYEAFSLWDRPAWTAWIALGYFAAAFAIDGFFRGGTFCKYVCPIGQFNFVQSLVSPTEVQVRSPQTCASCRTHDCLVGRGGSPGCEMQLHLPQKSSNLDCTLCLDCVQACPHDNIGVIVGSPLDRVSHNRFRSGLGRLSERTDLAALTLLLVFGAFANAAGMVAPVVEWQQDCEAMLGTPARWITTTVFYLGCLLIAPVAAVLAAGISSRRWARDHSPLKPWICRFTYGLVPLGFAMWTAHYSFHFFTSYDTAIPAAQRFAADLGVTALGKPQWSLSCCRPAADWVLQWEILVLDLGLLASLLLTWRIALDMASDRARALRMATPWAGLIALLFALGMWILFQPMEMRGTLPG